MAPRSALLLACGSFNPPTNMHLRLFELARDHLKSKGIEVLGGVISPVNDAYPKKELAPSLHRVKMVELAAQNYDLVKCSKWEAEQGEWTRTRAVLDHYSSQISDAMKSQSQPEWLPKELPILEEQPRLLLLCGGDLLETFSVPGLWQEKDIITIAKDYGLVVISREGSNPEKYVYEHDVLHKYRENIHLVTERIPNDISSTRIRKAVKRGESIRFLIPDEVVQYIETNKLYQAQDENEYYDACLTTTTSIVNEPQSDDAVENLMRESLSMSDIEPPPPLSPPPLDNTADHEQPPEICMNDSVVVDKVDKDEKELCCMETSSSPPVAETFDIIESNDVDAATNEVLAPNAEMPIDVSLAENLNVVDKIDQDQVVASPPSPKATKDEPSCPVIAPANEEDEEDCSCTTTGSRSPTPVHFEITPKGVKVISDKESFL